MTNVLIFVYSKKLPMEYINCVISEGKLVHDKLFVPLFLNVVWIIVLSIVFIPYLFFITYLIILIIPVPVFQCTTLPACKMFLLWTLLFYTAKLMYRLDVSQIINVTRNIYIANGICNRILSLPCRNCHVVLRLFPYIIPSNRGRRQWQSVFPL